MEDNLNRLLETMEGMSVCIHEMSKTLHNNIGSISMLHKRLVILEGIVAGMEGSEDLRELVANQETIQ